MFRTVPLSIIRSYSLYTQQSCSKAVHKPVWHIPLLSLQWITPDDVQRNCPKHVEFHSKNKFEKLVHLVGFIIRKFVTMHGHMNVKNSHNYFFQRHMFRSKTIIVRRSLQNLKTESKMSLFARTFLRFCRLSIETRSVERNNKLLYLTEQCIFTWRM
jgi:hypothetical protein